MSSITLSGLATYPIKSAGGMGLSQSQVTARGLLHDRRWMVCDRNGMFLTQRKFPKMALIRVAVDDTLHLNILGADSALELPLLARSEEHTSELQSPVPISYAVFCLKKKKTFKKRQ